MGAAKDFQRQRSQPASGRQRSHRISGLTLIGCRGNAKMGNRRAADEGSDFRRLGDFYAFFRCIAFFLPDKPRAVKELLLFFHSPLLCAPYAPPQPMREKENPFLLFQTRRPVNRGKMQWSRSRREWTASTAGFRLGRKERRRAAFAPNPGP